MPIDDSSILNRRYQYTPDLPPSAIYVASGIYIITLTTTSEPPKVSLLTYDATDTDHIIMIEKPDHAMEKRG